MKIRLWDMKKADSAIIVDLTHTGSMRRRLTDLGFTRSTPVFCLGKGPLGDPTAYYIKGTVIALRKEDAIKITVETEEKKWD